MAAQEGGSGRGVPRPGPTPVGPELVVFLHGVQHCGQKGVVGGRHHAVGRDEVHGPVHHPRRPVANLNELVELAWTSAWRSSVVGTG